MRRDRVERTQKDGGGITDSRFISFALRAEGFNRVEHLHAGRHHGVVLHTGEVEICLLQREVDVTAEFAGLIRESGEVARSLAHSLLIAVGPVPDTAQEAVGPFGTGVGPGGGLIGRTGEHHKAAGRVGTVLGNDFTRFHDVVLGLGHLFDAAQNHRLTVGLADGADRTALFVVLNFNLVGVEPGLVTVFFHTVIAFSHEHTLCEEVLERLVKLHQPHVTHDFRPEAGIEQMQHGVFDTADVLIHRHPVVVARIDHGSVAVGRAVALEVPGAVHKRVHRIGFTLSISTALRALALEERFALVERIAAAVRDQILGQNDRQILFGHRDGTAVRAVDDRNRGAPVALTGDAPVTQTELHLLFTQAPGTQIGGNGVHAFLDAETVVFAGVHQVGVAGLVTVPFLPGVGGEGFPFDSHHLTDREVVFRGKSEVTFVMSRHSHHGAFTVAHEDVVGDPDFNRFVRERMSHGKAGGHTLLFHGGHIGFAHTALGTFFDKGLQFGAVLGKVARERVFSGNSHIGCAHERIGTGRIHVQRLFFAFERVGEGDVHTFGAADPVLLHAADLLGPAFKLGEVVEKLLRVLRDAEVVARDFTLFNQCAGAPAAAFNHLFVGQHSLVDRVPVHNLGLAVGDALFEHLQEEPLIPAVVFGFAGCEFTRPVKGETERFHLRLHVSNVAVGPGGRGNFLGDSSIFSRQTESVPAHRRHHVIPLHAVVTVHDVVQGVVAHVPHVQLPARVGQHRADVELGLGFAMTVERVFNGPVDVLGLPLGLDFRFHCLSRVSLAHIGFQNRS